MSTDPVAEAGLRSETIDGQRYVRVVHLQELEQALGGEVLTAALMRCLVLSDRLVSLSEFYVYHKTLKGTHREAAYSRNLITLFWSITATLRYMGAALGDLASSKIALRLSGDGLAAWGRLQVVMKRWQGGPFKEFRDKAVKVSRQTMLDGMKSLKDDPEEVSLIHASGTKVADAHFDLASVLLTRGVLPDLKSNTETQKRWGQMQDSVYQDAEEVGELVTRVLLGLVGVVPSPLE